MEAIGACFGAAVDSSAEAGLDSTLIRQLNAPVRAAIGVPGKARRRSGLLPARRSNAAWRVERGAHGCVALSPRQ